MHDDDVQVGNSEVSADQVEELDDLYDSEVLEIDRITAVLSQKIGTMTELSAIQREVRERFAEAGFVARCDFYKDMNDPRPWDEKPSLPRISIVGRTEKVGEFDHERMGHEVRSNILGKNEQGDIQKKQIGQAGFSSTASGLIVPGG